MKPAAIRTMLALRSICAYMIPLLLVLGFAGDARAQMLDPAIDRPGEPFCYFSQPTDVVGVMDGREGTLITSEGYLYCGTGELMFFAGNPQVPLQQRVKTLYQGYLPVIEYECHEGGIEYSFRIFAATLDGDPESPLINFVRVNIRNTGREKRTTYFSTGLRYQNDANTDWGVGDNRFGRGIEAEIPGQFEQLGDEFSLDWLYSFTDEALLRDGKILYTFTTSVPHEKFMSLKMGYNESPMTGPTTMYVLPTTPVGIVQYQLHLQPGESQVLEFHIPYLALPADSPTAQALPGADFEEYLGRTIQHWDDLLARGIDIQVPEKKVNNTFRANLIYPLIARDLVDGAYIQKVNEFQYDAFWLRDAANIVRMYDISGYPDLARQCLDFFPRWQRPDGNFVSHGGQYDGWGQTLWAYGQHFRLTDDQSFARSVFPAVQLAVKWLQDARQEDPLGIMPLTTPGDNEDITGHVTGHNFWALAGLRNAIHLAEALEETADAAVFQQEYDDFRSTLLSRLEPITARTGGYMPPGIDESGGQDWGNLMAVYPEQILDPWDPRVTATLGTARSKYQEGLMTYGDGRYLHHYLTMKNTETHLIRGEQEKVIQDFYAILLHTSATHAGFEFSIRPWKDRDFGMNLAPHGWFAAEFRTLLRNMLVREEGDDLHLLSALSPEWLQKGGQIRVDRAPTEFGVVNLSLKNHGKSATLELGYEFVKEPKQIVLHLPLFMNVKSVEADSQELTIADGKVTIPPNRRTIQIRWLPDKSTLPYSYTRAVQDYQREYGERYQRFLREGN